MHSSAYKCGTQVCVARKYAMTLHLFCLHITQVAHLVIMVQGQYACGICRLTLLEVSAGTWTMIRSALDSYASVVMLTVKLYSAAPCPDTFVSRAPAIDYFLPIDHKVFAAGFQGLC